MPEAERLDEAAWDTLEGIVDDALASRPPKMVRQLRVFVRVILAASWIRYGRPFRSITDAQRARLLRGFENSRILVLRRGFWGLRTLVFMGYYGQPSVREALGYRIRPDGWASL